MTVTAKEKNRGNEREVECHSSLGSRCICKLLERTCACCGYTTLFSSIGCQGSSQLFHFCRINDSLLILTLLSSGGQADMAQASGKRKGRKEICYEERKEIYYKSKTTQELKQRMEGNSMVISHQVLRTEVEWATGQCM